MVDVGSKNQAKRSATATGSIAMSAIALQAIKAGNAPKGAVLATARIAGIMAAKRTGELIPLCHPLGLDSVDIDFKFTDNGLDVTATVSLIGKTGVEMEALSAVSVTLLTIYDMAKALDRAMVIGDIRLKTKAGGNSGDWEAD